MIHVELPAGPAPELVRALGACLASMTGTPMRRLPVPTAPGTDLDTAVAVWRGWLAGRGAGLVEVAGAPRFTWPGPWLALVDPHPGTARAVVAFGTPSGVVLSPSDATLLGRATADLPVRRGWVVAGREAALPAAPPRLPATGRVELLAIAPAAGAPMHLVPTARASPGRGLEGDRYAAAAGTFTPADPATSAGGYDLTLVAGEALDQVHLPGDGRLAPTDARRNVVTRGIDLDRLVGRRFRIGDVECLGRRRCEPCAHLERLTAPGALRALVHRGGLRADVLTSGEITVGATVRAVD